MDREREKRNSDESETVIESAESEAEEHENRSQAMMGNQNAKKTLRKKIQQIIMMMMEAMMMTITLDQEEFPNVIAAYGENAAEVAQQMAIKMGLNPEDEVTLNSILVNLESDLESDRLSQPQTLDED